MAKIGHQRVQETDFYKYPAQVLVDYYDIIHKLLEARVCELGIIIKGEGAHKRLIDTICLDKETNTFLQELREYRNKISYDGFMITPEYLKQHKERIEAIIHELS